ncbi:scarecrow-like protein 18 [Mercurialis annua]|uniref:scarecrow-like protein 18 n=1 Tax=Mercurialis annua TaxID=3986 RepID=UPI002160B2B9|nr:scarecrow-like protein 18 [Mercurialis annua]
MFNSQKLDDNLTSTTKHQVNIYSYPRFDDPLYHIIHTPPLQTCLQEIAKLDEITNGIQKPDKTNQDHQFSSTSLQLLKNYSQGIKRLSLERIIKPSIDDIEAPSAEELSTERIVRIAGERFIQCITTTVDVVSMLNNPFHLSLSNLSDDDAKKVELAELLLFSAEKVGNQHYERARILLNQCDLFSSSDGTSVERVVHYFCNALRDRIDRETGKCFTNRLPLFNIEEAIMAPTSNNLAIYQEVPFSKVAHFGGIQAIVENVRDSKRIHVIDLGIRIGVQWTGLMQSLASEFDSDLELLKITAVGTTWKQLIEETGERLKSFAHSINLPFSFNIVMVSDMLNLKEDQFEIDSDETVVVYCEYILRSLIPLPDRLDSMMKVIRILNPSIMVVVEPEYNSNSPCFLNRFVEALFYFSAYFDCLESCMGDDPNRTIIESLHFGEGIRNIVATEGEERKIRNAKLDVWRAFFGRFGMMETQLSTSSLCQAKLIAKKFACGNACTLDLDGKSLLIGWKGTAMHSLSAWKFM